MPGVVEAYVERKEENAPPLYAETLTVNAAQVALLEERDRLLNQLAQARSLPAVDIPPDLHQSFGRLAQIYHELGIEPELDDQLCARLPEPARCAPLPETAARRETL